jgi:hypothetical protein
MAALELKTAPVAQEVEPGYIVTVMLFVVEAPFRGTGIAGTPCAVSRAATGSTNVLVPFDAVTWKP